MQINYLKQLINKKIKDIKVPFSGLLPPPEQVVIFTRGRSGSNYLLSLLESHSSVRVCGEIFGSSQITKYKETILKSGSIDWYHQKIKRRAFEDAVISKFFYRFFEHSYAHQTGIYDLQRVYDYLISNKKVKVIHLIRHNKLKLLVSLRLAQITNQYTIYDGKQRNDDIQISLFPNECVAEFEYLEVVEKKFINDFTLHDNIVVHYEQLKNNETKECNRILDFLKLKRRKLNSRTIQQNTRPLYKVIKNYDALKKHFQGTKWESFFE